MSGRELTPGADQLLQPAPYPATRTNERDSVANELRVLREVSERAQPIAHDEAFNRPARRAEHLDGACRNDDPRPDGLRRPDPFRPRPRPICPSHNWWSSGSGSTAT